MFDEWMVHLPGAHPDGKLGGRYGQNTNGGEIRYRQTTYRLPGPAVDPPSQRADFGGRIGRRRRLSLRRHERKRGKGGEGGERGVVGSDWSEGGVGI